MSNGGTSSKTFDWAALVKQAEGPKLLEKDTEYRFSTGREFKAPRIPYQSPIPAEDPPA